MSARKVTQRPARGRVVLPRVPRRMLRLGVVLLLALHVALVLPGMLRYSITFDEPFHLPAGLLYLTRGYTHVSLGQPPLARAVYALPVLLMRPALPPDSILTINAERSMGQSFLSLNSKRFPSLFLVGRLVALLLSLLTGLLIFRLARELYGGAAGLLALCAWVTMPDVVAQAGVIGTDLPTALVYLLLILALRAVVRSDHPIRVVLLVGAFGAALLTRYSTLQLLPAMAVLVIWAGLRGRSVRRWMPAWALLAALIGGFALVDAGYLGQVSFLPFGKRALFSNGFKSIGHRFPNLVLPLPDAYIAGFDYLRSVTEGIKPIFVLGHQYPDSVWWYFPVAVAVKWPIGLLGLLVARVAFAIRHRSRRAWDEASVLLPAAAVIGVAMVSDLDYGVRYLLPALPFLCVAAGGLLARPAVLALRRVAARPSPARRAPARGWAIAAVVLVTIETAECALASPWQMSFFNAFAGGRGEEIVNDCNVDWGQGLLALRGEMKARGIRRIHMTYHGTVDPVLYGIDSVPYLGGTLGPESDWIAVSSYFLHGLPQRMVTAKGDTPWMAIDFSALRPFPVVARPAHCMVLVRLREP